MRTSSLTLCEEARLEGRIHKTIFIPLRAAKTRKLNPAARKGKTTGLNGELPGKIAPEKKITRAMATIVPKASLTRIPGQRKPSFLRFRKEITTAMSA